MTVEQAQEILTKIPEYAWLTASSELWFTTGEVAAALRTSPATVRSWCERGAIAGASDYGGRIGWRMPRSGLLLYFAATVTRQ
jgi:hypothetical protein